MNRSDFIGGKQRPPTKPEPLLPGGTTISAPRVQELIKTGRSYVDAGYSDVYFSRVGPSTAVMFIFHHPILGQSLFIDMNFARWNQAPDEYRAYLSMVDGIHRFVSDYFGATST